VERCLACEAVVNKGKALSQVLGAVCALRYSLSPFSSALRGGDPFGLASEATLHGWRRLSRKVSLSGLQINTGNSLNSCNSPICYLLLAKR
jgi:hypothetical protein